MKKEKLEYLIAEYRLAEKRLAAIQAQHLKLEVRAEVMKDLEKEFKTEIRRSKEAKDTSEADYWKNLLDKYLPIDQDRPNKDELKKARDSVKGENEDLIVYYMRKLKVIRKILGSRQAELMDSLAEKNMLLGFEANSSRLLQDLDDAKAEQDLAEKKKNINFDKM